MKKDNYSVLCKSGEEYRKILHLISWNNKNKVLWQNGNPPLHGLRFINICFPLYVNLISSKLTVGGEKTCEDKNREFTASQFIEVYCKEHPDLNLKEYVRTELRYIL